MAEIVQLISVALLFQLDGARKVLDAALLLPRRRRDQAQILLPGPLDRAPRASQAGEPRAIELIGVLEEPTAESIPVLERCRRHGGLPRLRALLLVGVEGRGHKVMQLIFSAGRDRANVLV